MPSAPRASALALAAVLVVAGCGSSGSSDGSGGSDAKDSSSSARTSGSSSTTIAITFKGDSVTPQGKKVQVEAGTPFTLKVTADKAGELHVHSSPESEVAYQAGTTTRKLTIDQPGVVDVESHDLDKLVVQLEVR